MAIENQQVQQVISLIQAKVPILWVTTYEEDRFIQQLSTAAEDKLAVDIYTWSSYRGIISLKENLLIDRAQGQLEGTQSASKALEAILKVTTAKDNGSIFIMKDFNTVLNQPIPRQLRDMYYRLIHTNKTIIILSPSLTYGPANQKSGIEPTLEKQITVIEYELPTRDIIETYLRTTIDSCNSDKNIKKFQYTDKQYHEFATALQGLTEIEVENAVATCLVDVKKLDAKRLLSEKKNVLKRSDVLEYISISPSMNDVGGCDNAKKYFNLYKDQFTPEAREFGIEPLRGVILTGIPGCGKSLLAKAVAAEWNLPLLRLDVGRVMTGLVGGSEARMRDMISICESCSPCILWVDEIEKSLSGTKSSNYSDGGTLSRVFGTLLTAMEERLKDVVVIATANDISALPPELIRRFDEVFFVDIPVAKEREEIFNIHLSSKKRSSLNLDMKELTKASNMYTGSEIERAVKEGIMRAYQHSKRELTTEDILEALKDTRPIYQVMGEKITEIREWAKNRARYASSLAQGEMLGTRQYMQYDNTDKELDQISLVRKINKKEVN